MPRRNPAKRLTGKQRERIDEMRERRLQNNHEKKCAVWEKFAESEVFPPEEGRVISHFGFNVEVEDPLGMRFRCAIRETAGQEPVCGDRVQWSRSANGLPQGVIWSIYARKNALQRPSFGGHVQTVAANIDLLMITLAADKPNMGLLDRYLVAAEANAMEAVVVVNKMDKLDGRDSLTQVFESYVEMGYRICYVSAHTSQGMAGLDAVLRDRTSLFAGHSGVGKSSIIGRWIQGEASPIIGASHEPTGGGRHTTTVARLYHLSAGGCLIDSPGIREFGLVNVAKESLAGYFRDIAQNARPCRFSNCSHQHEPECGVKEAVSSGKVSQKRYDSLLRIFHSL
ncbi:MAG: ribosome small subunit-dependent GTPase A [Nitrospirae bacterium]|nr:ribosome small subunit-dependent GTPase A [Magnetococcales bacterium]HAT49825.1 ribosome small subunit-dependent GTPase A [Alphaproteobacteria bacterium]